MRANRKPSDATSPFTKPWTILLASGMLLLAACLPTPNEQQAHNLAYFDLKSYFKREIQELSTNTAKLQKTITLDGQQETQTLNEVNWEQEMSLFMDVDLNRVAYQGKFHVDTSQNPGSHSKVLTYTALDHELPLRSVILTFGEDQQTVSEVQINFVQDNFLFHSDQNLLYQKGSGFSITDLQSILFLGEQAITIKSTLL